MDNTEVLSTLGTQTTGRKHWAHKPQDEDIGHTNHRTKTNKTPDRKLRKINTRDLPKTGCESRFL